MDDAIFDIEIDERPVIEAAPGVAWENLKLKANSKDLAKLMRDNGLLTYDDVRKDTRLVVALLQRIYGVDLATVLAFAKEQEVDNG